MKLRGMRASAGSGKTYALTTRYLEALAASAEIERILATTFTRKAAGEILERVLGRLARACRDPQALSALAADLKAPGLDPQSALGSLRALCDSLHRVSISTLDSYFYRLAHAVQLEMGVARMPELMEEGLERAQRLERDALRCVLAEAGGDAELIQVIDDLVAGEAPSAIIGELAESVVKLRPSFNTAPDAAWEWLADPGSVPHEEYAQALAALQRLQVEVSDKRLQKALAKVAEAATEGVWPVVLDGTLTASVSQGAPSYYGKPPPDTVVRALKPVVQRAVFEEVRKLRHKTLATRDFLRRFDRHYLRLCREEGLLSFGDLAMLLGQTLPGLKEGALAHRLDGSVDHILLDEFQDTDPLQWSILRPIVERARRQAAGSLFCVGDVKQAIYGWRGASAAIFERLDADIPGLHWEQNDNSYRSSKVILGAVDAVFDRLQANVAAIAPDDAAAQAAAQRWQRRYRTHTPKVERKGYVALVPPAPGGQEPIPAEEWREDAEPLSENEYAAAAIAELAAALAPYGRTIGVLTRRRGTAAALRLALHAQGVDAASESGVPLSGDPAVGLILSALQLADHPADTAAAFHVSCSPLAAPLGLRQWPPASGALARAALRIRQALVDEGCARSIFRWRNVLAPYCAARSHKRLMLLLELADEFDRRPQTLRPERFVQYVEQHTAGDANSAPVRVMTIHKAKGLEFDAVVLPELGRPLDYIPTRTDHLVMARRSGNPEVEAVCRAASKELRAHYKPLADLYDRRREETVEEALSLLYVALTRARHALILIPPRADGGFSAASLLKQALTTAPGCRQSVESICEDTGVLAPPHLEIGDPDWYVQEPGMGHALVTGPPIASGRPGLAPLTAPSPAQRRRAVERRASPSDLEKWDRTEIDRLLDPGARRSQEFGSLVHVWLSRIEWLDGNEAPGDDELLEVGRAACPTAAEGRLREQLAAFRELLRQDVVSAALCRPAAGDDLSRVELWRERRFSALLPDGLLPGAFDRVLVHRNVDGQAQRAELIDFKVDAVPPGGEEELVQRYSPQMRAYRDALCHLLRLPPPQVTCKLLLVTANRLIEV